MIRVYIADDHAILRHGLAQLIESADDMRLAGEATDGRAVLAAASSSSAAWDVLILDLSLPKVNGMEVLRRIKGLQPRLPIVVLSMHPEDQYALPTLRAGASAYLSKHRPGEELLAAVRRVARGGTYLTDTVAERVLHATPDKLPHETLTAREYQIFMLIVHGGSVTGIAAELDLTAGTVSGHLQRVKAKLGAGSIADLVTYAHRMGTID